MKDLVHHVRVTLKDLYKNKSMKLALTRNALCSSAMGRAGREGREGRCCQDMQQLQRLGCQSHFASDWPMIQQIQHPVMNVQEQAKSSARRIGAITAGHEGQADDTVQQGE